MVQWKYLFFHQVNIVQTRQIVNLCSTLDFKYVIINNILGVASVREVDKKL